MKRTYADENSDVSNINNDAPVCHSFKTCQRHRFDRNPPALRKPKEIGCYSVDKNRCFKHDKSTMKYFINPKNPEHVKFDLTDGYKKMIRKDETKKEFIDNILHWIVLNKEKFQLQTPGKNQQDSVHRQASAIC